MRPRFSARESGTLLPGLIAGQRFHGLGLDIAPPTSSHDLSLRLRSITYSS
jgi:hypothetical protein